MATINSPLLGSPKTPISACKTTLLILSIATIICLASFGALHLTTINHFRVCDQAHKPSSCRAILSNVATFKILPFTKIQLLQTILEQSEPHMARVTMAANSISHRINDPHQQMALSDCIELMDLSGDRLKDSVSALEDPTVESLANVRSWLSGVLTNHVTCSDELIGPARSAMEGELDQLMALASASLAIVNVVSPPKEEELIGRRIGDLPSWVSANDRRLLEASASDINADVVVAKDGSGKYKTVQEAVTAAPDKSKTRYVIYVKKGTYKEKVDIGKSKKNIMLVGEGMNSTIITGSLNFIDGTTTFNSATVAAVGDLFIAQDIWFQNTAGPEKHQAVALRVGADQSVINRCRIDAYQDTLYAHSQRQFYRDSTITGTVDFIFGNSAVVLQNCKLVARKPLTNQQNLVTAQGRTDPNQSTGTSIQNCDVIASSDLEPVKSTIPSYLGRPWKEYSRTMFMQSYIGDHVRPAGWLEWDKDFALKTLYYAEYANRGPGAGTGKRVQWPGYHAITDPNLAKPFTVAELIQGGVWLRGTGVAFTEGL